MYLQTIRFFLCKYPFSCYNGSDNGLLSAFMLSEVTGVYCLCYFMTSELTSNATLKASLFSSNGFERPSPIRSRYFNWVQLKNDK